MRRPDFLRLNGLEVGHLEQEAADLGVVGRIIIALLDPPEVVLLDQVQLVRAALDDDLRRRH